MDKKDISHDRNQETSLEKARWFAALTMERRIEVFCEFVNMILAVNPHLADRKDARQASARIQILERP